MPIPWWRFNHTVWEWFFTALGFAFPIKCRLCLQLNNFFSLFPASRSSIWYFYLVLFLGYFIWYILIFGPFQFKLIQFLKKKKKLCIFFLNSVFLKVFLFHIGWHILDLQSCVSFKYTAQWFNYTYTSILFQILFSYSYYRVVNSSVCYAIGSYWLSRLYIEMYI